MGARPSVLCVTDLSLVSEALDILLAAVDLDYRRMDRPEVLDIIHRYDAFWGHIDIKVDREFLQRAEKLKVINTASTGTDHIDKEETTKRDIKVLSITRDYGLLDTFTATAECAWMLLLACARHLRSATQAALEGRWTGEQFYGRQLSQHTLGVLGIGRLGRMTVEYGKAFRMRVLGCDLKSFEIPGVEQVDFDTLLSQSDAISIHIHIIPENYHLFNEETIAMMKDGVILVNTSRGDIVHEEALLAALSSGKLAAFGTDVLHDEWRKDMKDSPIVQYAQSHHNVVITPHIGGCTFKSLKDARIFSAQKLVHYLQTGEELARP